MAFKTKYFNLFKEIEKREENRNRKHIEAVTTKSQIAVGEAILEKIRELNFDNMHEKKIFENTLEAWEEALRKNKRMYFNCSGILM